MICYYTRSVILLSIVIMYNVITVFDCRCGIHGLLLQACDLDGQGYNILVMTTASITITTGILSPYILDINDSLLNTV